MSGVSPAANSNLYSHKMVIHKRPLVGISIWGRKLGELFPESRVVMPPRNVNLLLRLRVETHIIFNIERYIPEVKMKDIPLAKV